MHAPAREVVEKAGRTEIIEGGMVVDLLLPTIYRPGIGGPRVTDIII